MDGPHRIRVRAEQARDDSPSAAELADTTAAEAVMVREPGGEPAFWLVPFLRDDMAAGFATVTLDGRVERVGTFGSGGADRDAWVPATYFSDPPEDLLGDIRAHYADATLSEPILSYDRSPSRWAWRVQADPPSGKVIFIAPRGWYAHPPEGAE